MTDRAGKVLKQTADFTPEERREILDHLDRVVECDELSAE
jgi:hypothetical protein